MIASFKFTPYSVIKNINGETVQLHSHIFNENLNSHSSKHTLKYFYCDYAMGLGIKMNISNGKTKYYVYINGEQIKWIQCEIVSHDLRFYTLSKRSINKAFELIKNNNGVVELEIIDFRRKN